MKTELGAGTKNESLTWEEQSGLLAFLSGVQEEVARFEMTFGLGISNLSMKTLNPLRDFSRGRAALYDWLRALVKASCDKL